jgi:hypothetical protein
MKIRFDFVTNSSSTSFVIICKGKPKKEDFLAAMGAKPTSPFKAFFEDLFFTFIEEMERAEISRKEGQRDNADSVSDLLKRDFSSETVKRAKTAVKQGKDVWIGRLSSSEEPVESFFCCESLEVDHPKIYIDALECSW